MPHAYQRIADELRARILDGTLAPGEPVPTINDLADQHGVSPATVSAAMRILIGDGLVVSKPGTVSRVRGRPEIVRLTRAMYQGGVGSPWRALMAAEGRVGSWEASSEPVAASPVTAERLRIEPGDRVMCTRYVFTADGRPMFLSTSFEPLAITAGTPVVLPEDGPHAGLGVVDRMRLIGHEVRAREVPTARSLTEREAQALRLRAGIPVVVLLRTYETTDGLPVETADIVLSPMVQACYEIPVG